MTTSLLQGKQFFCREWAFGKIARCLDPAAGSGCDPPGAPTGAQPGGTSVQPPHRSPGTIIMGGPGCGKTALCCEIVWPTATHSKATELSERVIAFYFCQAHDVETLSVSNFIACISDQISHSPLLWKHLHHSPPEDQRKTHRLSANSFDPVLAETDPDEAFRLAVLVPLQRVTTPPPQTLFLLVDSLDESYLQSFSDRGGSGNGSVCTGSRTIAELLAAHHRALPSWLYLVCSARKQTKSITRLFAGFHKISLDDQRKTHVVRDVQQYILCRLNRDERLRQHLTRETAEMLNQLHIKSNACFLYLEKVLDGVVDSFIRFEEIRDMPGTLNGLYLWLCQRLLPRSAFTLVRPTLNVIFAARRPLTDLELYSCVVTRDTTLTYSQFKSHMTSLNQILMEGQDGTRILFHQSFAEWLLDVKYCTQRYLCAPSEGHAMLALSFTLHARTLTPPEIHHYAFHVAKSSGALAPHLKPYHYALWLISSSADVFNSLMTRVPREQAAVELLLRAGARLPTDEALVSSITGMSGTGTEDEGEGGEGGGVIEDILGREGVAGDELDSNGRTALSNAAFQGNIQHVRQLLERESTLGGVGGGAGGGSSGGLLEATDSTGQTALCLAARHGHVDVVAALITAGAVVDHADHDGWTPLRSASWGGHLEVVDLLLAAGAQVDRTDRDGRTALRAAAWGGHADIVTRLLDSGANINHTDAEGRTALIAAAYMGHADIVSGLLARGADPNWADIDGRTALSVAALCIPASRSHHAVVCALLEKGACVDHMDKDGMTPFSVAAYEGHADICELLLENEADVDHTDASGRSALEGAVCMGHAEVVRLLLFWGAYVDMIDSDGRTVLCSAAQQGNVEVVQLLLDRGLDETHRDNCGWSALHIAAFEGHVEVVHALLDAGAHILEMDNDGRVPLLLAAQEGHLTCIISLLDASTPIESRGHDGKTALRLAALEGYMDVVECLLDYGANVDYVDADRRTTLHALAEANQTEMTRFLLDRGADPSLSDSHRRTPLHIAAVTGHRGVAAELLNYGVDADARDRDSRTALGIAANAGHIHIVELLLGRGVEVDYTWGVGGETALGVAARSGHDEVVRALLAHGADASRADARGKTPGMLAAEAGHHTTAALLQSHRGAGGRVGRSERREAGIGGVDEKGGGLYRWSAGGGAVGGARDSHHQSAGYGEFVGGTGVGEKNPASQRSAKNTDNRLSWAGPTTSTNEGVQGFKQSGDVTGPGYRLSTQADRLAHHADSQDIRRRDEGEEVVRRGGGGDVRTSSPALTSGVSSINTKNSSSMAGVPDKGAQVTTIASLTAETGGGDGVGGERGISGRGVECAVDPPRQVSSNNSSKSSGIQAGAGTNSLSTNHSSSSGEGSRGAWPGSVVGVAQGTTTPLTFTQELQQCSVRGGGGRSGGGGLARRGSGNGGLNRGGSSNGQNKNRSLTRYLPHLTEFSVGDETPKGGDVGGGKGGRGAGDVKGSKKEGSRYGSARQGGKTKPDHFLPHQSSSSPGLLDDRRQRSGASDLAVSSEQVWTRQSIQRVYGRGGEADEGVGGITPPELNLTPPKTSVKSVRSSTVANPNYCLSSGGIKSGGGKSGGRIDDGRSGKVVGGEMGKGEGAVLGGGVEESMGGRPRELPLKKETPL